MEQRISFVTLGVKDLAASRAFYQRLGWKEGKGSNDHVAFFQANGLVFSLFPWGELAKDAQVSSEGKGFRGVAIAHNVRAKEDVATVLAEAERAGGKILKSAQDVFWGGHSGYFADPEGNLWEVAWNPFSKIVENGNIHLGNS